MQTSDSYPKAYLYRRIVQAKLYIDAHFREKINLDSIADSAAFSRFHFIRLFKQAYGKTPHQYLTSVRISEAERLMENDQLRIQDICFEVGFESISTFTGLFKKVRHVSPKVRRDELVTRRLLSRAEPLKVIPGCYSRQML